MQIRTAALLALVALVACVATQQVDAKADMLTESDYQTFVSAHTAAESEWLLPIAARPAPRPRAVNHADTHTDVIRPLRHDRFDSLLSFVCSSPPS